MRIFINDFELNNAANRVYVDPDINGLEMPSIRTSKGQRSGSHGGYIGKQLYDDRFISLKGRIFSDSVDEALQKRREIQQALPLFPQQIVLRIIDEDGSAYVSYCQVVDFQMPVGRFRGRSSFKIDLQATDPLIYDDTAGGELEADIFKGRKGGYMFSASSPVFGHSYYFSGSTVDTTINNPAESVMPYPIIVINGRVTNPTLTNVTTGQAFRLDNYSVGEGSVTQIDMRERTVRLGSESQLVDGKLPPGVGGSVFSYVPINSEWWGIVPGDNEINYESAGGSDVERAMLYWRPAYWGL